MRDRAASQRLRRNPPVFPALLLALLAVIPAGADTSRGTGDSGRGACDFGITLALTGETARAESVFIALLSSFPDDAAAFTNLGNLHLLDGDPELALAFYRRAREADSSDAGIVLDQATALLLLDDAARAVDRAQLGLTMAGGAPAAAALLGLRYRESDLGSRGAQAARLSREEVLEMLRAAAGRVPVDSTRVVDQPDSVDYASGKQGSQLWRAAGPRAGNARALPTYVYWRR